MKNLTNNVQLIGHLGITPEMKEFDSGKKIVNFTLATTDSYINQQGQKIEDTQWHKIVAWGKTAEYINNYVDKGNRVAISGKLVHRAYTDKDNQTRYITEIVVNEILMLTPKSTAEAA